jgi:hypothetical protein
MGVDASTAAISFSTSPRSTVEGKARGRHCANDGTATARSRLTIPRSTRNRVNARIDEASTWPLPGFSGFAVLATTESQAGALCRDDFVGGTTSFRFPKDDAKRRRHFFQKLTQCFSQ